MNPQQTGKLRAARVPIDYYKKPNPWKTRLTVLCGGLALAAAGVCVAWGGWWRQASSPGPVQLVHAAWETQCETCHVPFRPMSSANQLARWTGLQAASDQRCTTCHAGPPHHANQKADEVPTCGGCHREHGGRLASLVQLPDSACTSCHANLPAHTLHGTTEYAAAVTRFDVNHPDFRVLDQSGQRKPLDQARDPGRLRFTHKVHMTPGLKSNPDDRESWTLSRLRDQALREEYRRMQPEGQRGDEAPVQLQCSSCHRLEREHGRSGDQPATPTAGAFMMPVTYETACRACHPLSFQTERASLTVPHGLQPADVRRFLWGALADQEQQRRAAPGGQTDLPWKGAAEQLRSARRKIDGEVKTAEFNLYATDLEKVEKYVWEGRTTCGCCHDYVQRPGQRTPVRIVPTAVPTVWFPHASFNHLSHRAITCQSCHPNADAQGAEPHTLNPTASTSSKDILVPGIQTCLRCHSPRRKDQGQMVGGVRFGCTTCHRYHHGDSGFAQGLAAPARGAKQRRGVQPFLTGASK